ncbi:MAG: LLM class flavin-dependent oxidoreductase [Dehalococcoidia bacterium]|nr:LLM class flavin-dependent oxidoreductase [Dehalococcoidia bacterium]
MRIGLSMNSSYAVDDPREGARRMIERAAAARDAGLDSLFVGDHHVTGPRAYYQNIAILGRMLAEWGDKPAGALFLLPLWHPVLLAEQVATLASIHEGPFIMQCAVGPADEQFTGMGVNAKHRPSRFEECLDLMRRLWAGETVSADHRYQFTDARIGPLPPEPIEVWIGGEVDAALERAASLGDGWLGAPGLTPDQAAYQATRFLQHRASRDEPATVAIRRDVYVGETDEEAQRIAGPIVERGYRGFDPSAVIFGSPETVADRIREYAGLGFTDVIVRSLVPDQRETIASLGRLAEVRELVADA